jgi:hypothetical protein
VKAVLALAVVGLVAVGCGAGMKTGSGGPLTVTGTTTIANVKTGALIRCKGGPGAEVPPTGQGVGANADGPSSSGELQLSHRQDGSVVAVCSP